MREYNVKIQEEVVVGVAEEVIQYLEQFPGDYVECTVTKVILDEESSFSDKSIIEKAEGKQFPLLFNGEEVDQLGFLGRMFEMRAKLISRVTAYVREIISDDPPTIADQEEISYLISKIAEIVSTIFDNLR